MRDIVRGKRRLPVLAGALAMALAIATLGGHCAFAQTAADEDDELLDAKLFKRFMKDLGLRQGDEGQIEYRERAPLVVPPSRSLPPPQSGTIGTNNPTWPKDPDVNRRRQEAAAKKKPGKIVPDLATENARPLRPNEIERGTAVAGGPAGTGKSPEEANRPMRPNELGSPGLFSTIISSFAPEKAETAPFTGEPPRENLTAPPIGYQTPSPNQPYGISPKKGGAAPTNTFENRTAMPR